MKFRLTVNIADPNGSGKHKMVLDVHISYNEQQYGNGCCVVIKAAPNTDSNFNQAMDVRYDTSFHRNAPQLWILSWAYSYWSGTNGAWRVTGIELKEA